MVTPAQVAAALLVYDEAVGATVAPNMVTRAEALKKVLEAVEAAGASLLEKYMAYVVDAEGADYVTVGEARHMSEVKFSRREWAELERIAAALDESR